MTPLLLAAVFAMGLAVAQDAGMSILWYLGNSEERWSFNHAARLFRLSMGITLMVISAMELVKL